MKYLLNFLLLISPILFPGCAYLHTFDSDLPDQINIWIKQQKYGKALETLDYVKPTHKEYKVLMQQKQRTEKLAKKFESRSLAEAKKLSRDQKWRRALLNYDNALEKLPDSKKLQQAKASFLEQRDAYLKKLELTLLVNKGEWLSKNMPIQQKIKRALPEDYRSISGVGNFETDIESTKAELVECTQTAISAGYTRLARQCLKLAEKMGEKPVHNQQLAKVKKRLTKNSQSLIREKNKKTRALLAELKQGFSHENLQRAHEHLKNLERQRNKNAESRKLQKQLKKQLNAGISQQIKAGRQLYNKGKIEQALKIWEPLKVVAPNDQKLEAHISRAKRVLAKLRHLHQEGPAVKPPIKTQ